MNCDYKGCKEWGASQCSIIDVSGEQYLRCFCVKHLKKMLWDEKYAIYKD
jgi:hypothetical protein